MNEENAGNGVGNFLILLLTKSLLERFCNEDHDSLEMIFWRHTNDLYDHTHSFSAHSNFEEIKNVVLLESSEASLKTNSNLVYFKKVNSDRKSMLSTKVFFNNLLNA